MKTPKHTKGPWNFNQNTGFITSERGFIVAENVLSMNTHLIAAAPEMYEMLDALQAALSIGVYEKEGYINVSNQISSILKKARGES